MNYYDIYITLIFIVKFVFIILALYRLFIKTKKPNEKELLEKLEIWKKKFEFIFVTLMSILLIYLFNPRSNNISIIDRETKLLFYLFGFVLLLTENWSSFIHESLLFQKIQTALR
jgi:hypothetical protein